MRNEKGFTLIELLIVVAIIGIIAAIAIPSLLSAMDRARQSATVATINGLAKSVMNYAKDHPKIGSPKSADIDALATDLNTAGYSDSNEAFTEDGWDNPLEYDSAAAPGRDFTITSYGSDLAAGPAPVDGAGTPVKRFQEDIIWVNNNFYQAPEGNQTDQ